jgi:peptidase E
MKQLLLCGGRPWKANGAENALERALLNRFQSNIKVAFCNFARTATRWDDTDEASVKLFTDSAKGLKVAHKSISHENFDDVSKWADVIYMPGGDPFVLKTELDAHPNLDKIWDNKIVAGSSAGADVMCSEFAFLQDKDFDSGYGWVSATCIPHWRHYTGYADSDWDELVSTAIKRRPDLAVLCIPEGRYVEFAVQ